MFGRELCRNYCNKGCFENFGPRLFRLASPYRTLGKWEDVNDHWLDEMRDDSLRAGDDFAVFLSSMHVLKFMQLDASFCFSEQAARSIGMVLIVCRLHLDGSYWSAA